MLYWVVLLTILSVQLFKSFKTSGLGQLQNTHLDHTTHLDHRVIFSSTLCTGDIPLYLYKERNRGTEFVELPCFAVWEQHQLEKKYPGFASSDWCSQKAYRLRKWSTVSPYFYSFGFVLVSNFWNKVKWNYNIIHIKTGAVTLYLGVL